MTDRKSVPRGPPKDIWIVPAHACELVMEDDSLGGTHYVRAAAETDNRALQEERDAFTLSRDQWKQRYVECDSLRASAEARIAELEARLQTIIDAYDAYRGRGVIPAPGEYAAVVAAIDAARAAPTRGEGELSMPDLEQMNRADFLGPDK